MPGPIKFIIVEDEFPARRLLNELLVQHRPLIEIIGEADDGKTAIKLINKLRPDGIFLDIKLPDMVGFEVLAELEYKPFVIFTTAYDEYAIKAFDSLSVDYLLKPIEEEKLLSAISKLQFYLNGDKNTDLWTSYETVISNIKNRDKIKILAVKKGNKFSLVQLSDVPFIEGCDKYSFVHVLDGKKIFCDYMLSVLENKLSNDFVRVQKSYVVNKACVLEIQRYSKNRYTIVINDKQQTKIITGPTYHALIQHVFGV